MAVQTLDTGRELLFPRDSSTASGIEAQESVDSEAVTACPYPRSCPWTLKPSLPFIPTLVSVDSEAVIAHPYPHMHMSMDSEAVIARPYPCSCPWTLKPSLPVHTHTRACPWTLHLSHACVLLPPRYHPSGLTHEEQSYSIPHLQGLLQHSRWRPDLAQSKSHMCIFKGTHL